MAGRFDTARLSIRHQLWGLFGLFLLTGALVLVLDEVSQYYTQRTMLAMKDDVLDGMRRIRRLSDAYSLDLVDTTFKARNALVEWEQAVAVVDRAQATIEAEWTALQGTEFVGDDRALLEQALLARPRADAAAQELRKALVAKDVRALGRFADQELYPAIDPLTERLQVLAERGQFRADALVQAQITQGTWVSRTRVALSLLCFVLVALFGRRILRNGYRGVESLHALSHRMAQHDYDATPHYRPTGELGDVLDSFLRMRDCWRIILRVAKEVDDATALEPDWILARLKEVIPHCDRLPAVVMKDVYGASKRVAERYVAGRIVLAGDSAHVTNTRGGMNMNCGLHDAYAVALAIVRALRGEGPDVVAAAAAERRRVATDLLIPRTDRNVAGGEQWLEKVRAMAADPAQALAYLRTTAMLDMTTAPATAR